MSKFQGELDGLCGPYAIANALELCGISDAETAFQAACRALPPNRWPGAIWAGTGFGDLKKMLKYCKINVDGAKAIKVSYPFSRNVPKNNASYWTRFNQLFEIHPGICCVIVGITRPNDHWIVASRDGNSRILFTDTNPYALSTRKNRSSLHAGSRHSNPNKWIIEPSELIMFEIVSAGQMSL